MKKVFEYMNWCKKEFACHHYDFCSASGDCKLEQGHNSLNGNDMVLAINTMKEKGHLCQFIVYIADNDLCNLNQNFLCCDEWTKFMFVLFGNPENFFKLMQEWLEKCEIIGNIYENPDLINEV